MFVIHYKFYVVFVAGSLTRLVCSVVCCISLIKIFYKIDKSLDFTNLCENLNFVQLVVKIIARLYAEIHLNHGKYISFFRL